MDASINSRDGRLVAVTGMGVVCNLGPTLADALPHLREGRPGPFTAEPTAEAMEARCRIIGHVTADVSDEAIGITKKEGRFFGRSARLALRAAREAIARSGLNPGQSALFIGSGTGDVPTHQEVAGRLASGGARRVSPTVVPRLMSSTVSANLATVLRTDGPSLSIAAACAGGAANLALAALMIRSGQTESALAGGVESYDPHFHAGFDAMQAYNGTDNDRPERASRPYAADRAGFIFAEGAGVLALESLEHARARGAEVLGLILGSGLSSNADGQMVVPSNEGGVLAMRRALAHAGILPEHVDYINTHGTSTPLGDVAEAGSIRSLFGDHRVGYGSTKGYTGHTISAAGAIEAAFTLEMLRGGWLAPSVNADPLDPELEDYPPLREIRRGPWTTALSNSFGFGGTNVCLALGRGD
ncbi:MAG: beta-ketoacyl synthase [Candidatus Krumholzibacteriia bacterium]